MADVLTLTTFAPLVGQKFQATSANDEKEELELIEADATPVHGNAPRQDPFSLVFRAAKGCGLWQGIFQLEHKHIGCAELFLVPIGEDEEGVYFQALFN